MNLKIAPEAAHHALLLAQSEPPRTTEARAWTVHAISLAPTSWSMWNNAGVIEEQLGSMARAMRAYRHAIGISPTKPEPLRNLGALAQKTKSLQVAARAHALAVRLRPRDAEGWLRLANVLVYQREDVALASFQRGLLLHGWPFLTAMRIAGGKPRLQQLLLEEQRQLQESAVPESLVQFVRNTRRLENSTAWAKARWLQCSRSSATLGDAEIASCDDYGAHFFTSGSFLKVLHSRSITSAASAWAARATHDRSQMRSIVLGSGLGEQCAFILAAWPDFQTECWGYERGCQAMANLASELAVKVEASGPSWPKLKFLCNDALLADLTEAWLLVVNNNGWPDSLTRAIVRLASTQLPSGAAIALHRWPEHPMVESADIDAFGEAEHISLETSWREDARVVVYIRK